MDNLGAIGGPLVALALVTQLSIRTTILLTVIPGLMAVAAILYAVRTYRTPPSGGGSISTSRLAR